MNKTKAFRLLAPGALATWYALTHEAPESNHNAQQNPCSIPTINCR